MQVPILIRISSALLTVAAMTAHQAKAEPLRDGAQPPDAENPNSRDSQNKTAKKSSLPLEEIIVRGRAQTYYLQKKTATGAKFDIEILDLPQAIQVLTKQQIEDQAARDVTDLYRSVAGVSEYSYSGVTFRGFRQEDATYDGVRGDPFSGFSVPRLFNVKSVDVLKGPAGSLYGSGQPGGIINYSSDVPGFEKEGRVRVTGGNFNLKGINAEYEGPITDSIAFRVSGFYEDEDSFRNNAAKKNQDYSASLLFEYGGESSVVAKVTYRDQELGGHRIRGVPVDIEGNFLADRSFSVNEASDFQEIESWVTQLTHNHAFDESFYVKTTVRYVENERNQAYHEPLGWQDVNGDGVADARDGEIGREYRVQERTSEQLSVTLDVVKLFELAGMDHQLVVGGDYFDNTSDFLFDISLRPIPGVESFPGQVPNINTNTLNYGEANPDTYLLLPIRFSDVQADNWSAYLQHRVEFTDRWSLMVGTRYDRFADKDLSELFTDRVAEVPKVADDNFANRAGLVFKPVENASLYLNYSESFLPIGLGNLEDPDTQTILPPEEGISWELGWKHEWRDGAMQTTIAVYNITKQNVPQDNPADTGFGDGQPERVSLGEVESEGLELTLVGDLTDTWTVTANYAYNEAIVNEGDSIRDTFDGERFANAPKHQAGIWSRVEFESIDSSLALGADYVSERVSASAERVKPYTIFDANWQTSWDDLSLQINVKNILDKVYARSGFARRQGSFPGAPRTFIVQLTYDF